MPNCLPLQFALFSGKIVHQLPFTDHSKYEVVFLSDPGVPGVRFMGPDVRPSVSERLFADLTDVTLADEDINSIPADDVNEQSQAM